ncbi:MAG TPA: DUF1028 domain-containing protein [Candidatus Eisenbacteria bacterium]|nr:DUF1028 domain-containing protein [Candidatus Eisenbacteria bacterium]
MPPAILRRARRLFGLCLLLAGAGPAAGRADSPASTFSIVAYDSVTQEVGVAVQSKYFSVGTAVPWVEAGAGAVATQANVNVSLGPKALALLRTGMSASDVMKALAATDSLFQGRQVGIVDARGGSASWTGTRALDWAGGETGPGFACQGNILAGPAVVAGMAKAFRETRGELAERMIAALEAAQAAGGDKRGQQSAAILIARPSESNPEYNERYIDLRVEDHKTPIKELRRVWQIFQGFHLANAHLNYAAHHEAAGRRDLAALERSRVGEILERALARGERDPSVLNGLAWACATNDIFLPQALQAAERAVAADRRNVDILDTLAEVHFRMGNSVKAIEVESRAATIDPKSQYLKDQIKRFRGEK